MTEQGTSRDDARQSSDLPKLGKKLASTAIAAGALLWCNSAQADPRVQQLVDLARANVGIASGKRDDQGPAPLVLQTADSLEPVS